MHLPRLSRDWPLRLGAGLLVAAVFVILRVTEAPPLGDFALKSGDVFFKLITPAASPEVVFVAVDEKAVKQFGRWPWDRRVVAAGLAKLSEASVVGLDMVFSEPTTPEADAALAATLGDMGNVVAGYFFRNEGKGVPLSARVRESELTRLKLNGNPFQECTAPEENLPAITGAAALSGVFSITADADSLLRRYTVAFSHDGAILPSLGLQMLRLHFNKDVELASGPAGPVGAIAGLPLEMDANGAVRLNYSKRGAIPTVSFADVASGVVPPSYFKGKLVVLGVSEAGVTDIRPTPLGNIPGPWVHCTFLGNVLQKQALHENLPLGGLTLALALLIPVAAGVTTMGAFGRLTLTAATGAGVVAVCFFARLHHGLYVDYFYAVTGLASSFGLQQVLLLRDQEGRLRFAHTLKTHDVSGFQLEHHERAGVILPLDGVAAERLVLLAATPGGLADLPAAEQFAAINAFTATFEQGVQRLQGVVLPPCGEACLAVFNPSDTDIAPVAAAADFALALAGDDALPSAPSASRGPTILLATGAGTLGRLGGSVLQVYTGYGAVFTELAALETAARRLGPGIYAAPGCAPALAGHLAHAIPFPSPRPGLTAPTWLRVLPSTEAGQQVADDFKAAAAALADRANPDHARRLLDDCVAYHFDGAARLLRDDTT